MIIYPLFVIIKMMKTILKSENQYILRLDRGEELISSLKKFCKKEKIGAGFFWGLGSAARMELAYYDLGKKKYFSCILLRSYRGC